MSIPHKKKNKCTRGTRYLARNEVEDPGRGIAYSCPLFPRHCTTMDPRSGFGKDISGTAPIMFGTKSAGGRTKVGPHPSGYKESCRTGLGQRHFFSRLLCRYLACRHRGPHPACLGGASDFTLIRLWRTRSSPRPPRSGGRGEERAFLRAAVVQNHVLHPDELGGGRKMVALRVLL